MVPHRVLAACDVVAKDQLQNYGAFVPSTDEVKQVLDMLDGFCTDRELEHKEVLDCIAAKGSPFVYLSFKVPLESGDRAKCNLWLRTAVYGDRRWIVADGLLSPDSKAAIRHRYALELHSGSPTLYFANTDLGGPQMTTCQAPGAVDNFHREENLPNDLRNFFLCDSWH
jgi:hypothetical protein